MLNILPERLAVAIKAINSEKLYEIRIRANKPVIVNYDGVFNFLNSDGSLTQYSKSAIKCSKSEIASVILRSASYSIYAYNEQIKQGYITLSGGARIGISGNLIVEDGKIITVNDIYSLNIRVPHQVLGCAKKVIKYITNGSGILNTLILSPPGLGKTTLLRDISVELCKQNKIINVLIIDEKNEICAMQNGENMLAIGDNCDVYSNCGKQYAINIGIKTMRPDVIITDELLLDTDLEHIFYASTCGVSIISSIHCKDIQGFLHKTNAKLIVQNKVFERYIILSDSRGVGTVEKIYDENLQDILIGNL